MFDDSVTHSDRRGFLTRTAAGAAMAALATLPTWVETAAAQTPALPPEVDQHQGWIRGIHTKYRQLFETPKMDNFIGLHHINNYYGAWRGTAGVGANDMTAVLGVTGFAVPVILKDAMWSKYSLGKMMNFTDASTGQPYTRNPYMNPQNGELFGAPTVTPTALQQLGAKIILCNNAFGLWIALISGASSQQPAAVRAELLANMQPGVTLVPAMVQAVEQAQRAGLTYMKNG
jgi:hypothetical protein